MWKDKDKRRGLIATFIVHLFLLFALFFMALRTPLPLPGEEGVEVNFGYDEQGYGEIQSESAPAESQPTPPPPEEIKPEPVEPDPVVEEEEIITQDVEEAPVIEEEIKEEEPEEKPVDSTFVSETEEVVEEIVEEPKPVVNQRAIYPGTSKNKDGTNQGIKPGKGDMGIPEGYKDSDKFDGQGGLGNGISFSLGGRGGKFLEIPKNVFNESGTVVVRIEVDRSGNVVNTTFLQKGSDVGIFDEKVKLAINAAKNSKFTEKQDAPDRQVGTITYKFIK